MISNVNFNGKCVLFIKTLLLIIFSVIDDWNAINMSMLLNNTNKYCIDILKEINNLRKKKKRKMLNRHPFFHTPLYTLCIRKRKEERKEKVCLLGVHISTCQIFVWVSKGVLSPKGVYVSLLKKKAKMTFILRPDEYKIKMCLCI